MALFDYEALTDESDNLDFDDGDIIEVRGAWGRLVEGWREGGRSACANVDLYVYSSYLL